MQNIIVATIKEWNISNYFYLKQTFLNQYNFHLISCKEELTIETIRSLKPLYIFFPHWSWIIPSQIYKNYNCIVFHMTDLPFGRGGSPLQNLIIRGMKETKISAIEVEKDLDSGSIYMQENLDISSGSAQDIFINFSHCVFKKMIPFIIENKPEKKEQFGKVVTFNRRTPEQSNILKLKNPTLLKIYDFIRMLDAPSYPKAYLYLETFKIELSKVDLKDGKLIGKFEVLKDE